MRLNPSRPTWMFFWPRTILQVSHDQAVGGVCPGGFDHRAGPGAGLAVPDRSILRFGITGTGSRAAPAGETPGGPALVCAVGLDPALPGGPGWLYIPALPGRADCLF